ncbi:hypothetical protein XbC2_8 [Xanthomonas phage XbC2]|nr:hypothetical protein XbC2_8 [Xanthomonas phage XbC2]
MRYWKNFVNSLHNRTNDEIISMCKSAGLQQLGKVNKWSSRIVFAINDNWVIKICLSEIGVEQNECEYRLWDSLSIGCEHYKKYFAKLYPEMCDTVEYRFIVMQRLTNSTETKKGLIAAAKRYSPNTKKFRNAIKDIDLHSDLCNEGDIKASNLGKDKNGKIKLLDYGCSRKVVNAFYRARWNNDTAKVIKTTI